MLRGLTICLVILSSAFLYAAVPAPTIPISKIKPNVVAPVQPQTIVQGKKPVVQEDWSKGNIKQFCENFDGSGGEAFYEGMKYYTKLNDNEVIKMILRSNIIALLMSEYSFNKPTDDVLKSFTYTQNSAKAALDSDPKADLSNLKAGLVALLDKVVDKNETAYLLIWATGYEDYLEIRNGYWESANILMNTVHPLHPKYFLQTALASGLIEKLGQDGGFMWGYGQGEGGDVVVEPPPDGGTGASTGVACVLSVRSQSSGISAGGPGGGVTDPTSIGSYVPSDSPPQKNLGVERNTIKSEGWGHASGYLLDNQKVSPCWAMKYRGGESVAQGGKIGDNKFPVSARVTVEYDGYQVEKGKVIVAEVTAHDGGYSARVLTVKEVSPGQLPKTGAVIRSDTTLEGLARKLVDTINSIVDTFKVAGGQVATNIETITVDAADDLAWDKPSATPPPADTPPPGTGTEMGDPNATGSSGGCNDISACFSGGDGTASPCTGGGWGKPTPKDPAPPSMVGTMTTGGSSGGGSKSQGTPSSGPSCYSGPTLMMMKNMLLWDPRPEHGQGMQLMMGDTVAQTIMPTGTQQMNSISGKLKGFFNSIFTKTPAKK